MPHPKHRLHDTDSLQGQLHLLKKYRSPKHHDLHGGDASILRLIARHNSRFDTNPTAVKLSQMLGITQATITPMVERLVQKGLVERAVSPTDKRAKLLSLTPQGVELLQAHHRQEQEQLQRLMDYLGEEDTAQLTRILTKITTYLEENRPSTPKE